MFGVAGLRAHLLAPDDENRSLRVRIAYSIWAAIFVAGHILGGAILGAATGWLGGLLPAMIERRAWVVLGFSCLAWSLQELGGLRLPMPQLPRQVPRGWIGRLPWNLVAFGYGLQLGCGVATRITMTTVYAVLGCALLSGSPLAGAGMLGAFGAARSLTPLLVGLRVSSPEKSRLLAVSFSVHESRVKKLNGLVLFLTGIALAGSSWLIRGAP